MNTDMNAGKRRAPYLVLILTTLSISGCAPLNRQILSQSKNDRPPAVNSETQSRAARGKSRIWFVKENGANMEPAAVDRAVNAREPIRDAVNQLLQGPTKEEAEAGLKSEVPVGTVLIGIERKGDAVDLNLSKRFAAGGIDSIQLRLDQLTNTVKEAAGPTKVFLNVEGQRLLTAGDGLEVKQPLN